MPVISCGCLQTFNRRQIKQDGQGTYITGKMRWFSYERPIEFRGNFILYYLGFRMKSHILHFEFQSVSILSQWFYVHKPQTATSLCLHILKGSLKILHQ